MAITFDWIQLEDEEQAAPQNKAFSWPYTQSVKNSPEKSGLGAGNRNKAFSSLYIAVEDQGHGYLPKESFVKVQAMLLVK